MNTVIIEHGSTSYVVQEAREFQHYTYSLAGPVTFRDPKTNRVLAYPEAAMRFGLITDHGENYTGIDYKLPWE